MIEATPSDAAAAATGFAAKTTAIFEQSARWIGGNLTDILIASAIGLAIALLLIGLRSLGAKLMRRGADPGNWHTIFARTIAKTGLFFIVMCSIELVAEHANTPAPLLRVIHFLFVIAAAFQAAVWARELILGFVEHRVGTDTENTTLGSAIGIIRLLVTIALFAIALILILDNLGVNVTGLVAGLGIGGIAIGLAAQGIFSDLFAALAIIFDKPFRRGDGIRVDTISGTVEDIGLKTTRIRSLDGEQVVVSNAQLLDKQLHNFTNLEHRRITLSLGVVYQTPPETCARIPDMMRTLVEAHPKTQFVRCGMVGFGASSLDFELIFDVHSTDYEQVYDTRSSICMKILQTFAEAGIDFAYPTQTTFTAAPDGTMVMPYPPVKVVATEDLEDGG